MDEVNRQAAIGAIYIGGLIVVVLGVVGGLLYLF
jgi:hypothetical protein